MPHIIVEHTKDVDNVQELLEKLHQSLASQETVVVEAIKTRAVPLDHVVVGDGTSSSMMHTTLKLLPGRDNELRNKMATDLLFVMQSYGSSSTARTVETAELHQESYQK
ncbi:MAG: hypothetical protein HRT94_06120 [Alphaproteobacteria bacterium]|nr:hypothetical protein [Alphaproteobacteria bacterium]